MQPSNPQSQQILARAFAAHQAGNLAQAEFLYKLVLQADKKQFDALHMLGVIEGQRGNFAAGLARINEALRIWPKSTDALINLGRMQGGLGQNADAAATYKKVLALDPRSALAHSNFSIVLRLQRHYDEALAHCDTAVKLAPNYADAWTNRGNVLFNLNRFDDALADYDKAVALQPTQAHAHLGRGNVLSELERHADALAAYDHALAINSNLADAWLGRGNNLYELKRHEEALAAYDRALALAVDLAEAWNGRGNVFLEFKRYADALAAYDKALNSDPDLAHAAGHHLHMKLNICDWTNLEAEITHLLSALRDRKRVSASFPLLSIRSSPADQLQCARQYASHQPRFRPISNGQVYARHDRIRVAYGSSDLREHAVANSMIGLFEHHDRSRFETTAISFDAKEDSEFRRRIKASFECFIDVPLRRDEDVAAIVRQLEIDIFIDLNGLTRNRRMGIFARRPAPIQVNYLGYPGTMGAEYYDYILADPTVIPEEHFEFYSEKVVWLPDSFFPNDASRVIAARTPTRGELNLPETGFVFYCFNQSYKIDLTIFDVWMRLLKAVEGSVLWLKENDATASRNLRLEAARRGVAPERLVFAPSVPQVADHLARQRQADLFLDTVNYNAHTTASDALWAGIPVLTCIGSTFAGRVAASLLRAIGLPELVTESLADYEALALKLAREPALLGALKAKLARNRESFPCSTPRALRATSKPPTPRCGSVSSVASRRRALPSIRFRR